MTTTDRFMDFDVARAEVSEEATPLTFKLGGETWTIRTDISGAMILDFLTADNVTGQLRAGKDLMVHAVAPSQQDAFRRMLLDGRPARPGVRANKSLGIKASKAEPAIPPPQMSQLDQVMAWLVKELLGRPTEAQ